MTELNLDGRVWTCPKDLAAHLNAEQIAESLRKRVDIKLGQWVCFIVEYAPGKEPHFDLPIHILKKRHAEGLEERSYKFTLSAVLE